MKDGDEDVDMRDDTALMEEAPEVKKQALNPLQEAALLRQQRMRAKAQADEVGEPASNLRLLAQEAQQPQIEAKLEEELKDGLSNGVKEAEVVKDEDEQLDLDAFYSSLKESTFKQYQQWFEKYMMPKTSTDDIEKKEQK